MNDLQSHKPQFEEFSKKILDELNKSDSREIVLRQPQSLHDGVLSSITQDFIKKQRSYKHISSILSSVKIIQMYGADCAEYLLTSFIYKLITENKNLNRGWFQYDQSIFEKTFAMFIHELLEPNWMYSTFCILLNFKSDIQSIAIDNDVKIERFGIGRIAGFMGWDKNQLQSYYELEKEIVFWHPFVLVRFEKIKKEPDNRVLSNSPSAYLIIDNLLTALRLFKAGDISTGNFFYSRRSEFFNFVVLSYSWTSTPKFLHHFGKGYLLTKDEVSDFMKFRIQINDFITKSKNFNQILLSLRYFNATYRSDEPDDKLIDCITSLEALFKIDSELAFKLSFRISHLLSKSDEERKKIFLDVKKFYNTRNHLVHGSKLKEVDRKNIRNVEMLTDYVRRCLKAFINLAIEGKLTSQFYEDMDVILMNEDERTYIQKVALQT